MRLQTIIVIILIVLSYGCRKEYSGPNVMRIYGHGGSGFDDLNSLYAPNSVGSISRGLDFYDLDGVEIDVQFTQDGELVVFHDGYLETSTQCKGLVNGLKLDETIGCYYRKQFNNKYEHTVISLDSFIVLVNAKWTDKYISLNVQDNFEIPYILDSLAGLFHAKLLKFNSLEKISIECSDANFLYFLKQRRNKHRCYLVADIDSVGVRDVNRFQLEGIVAKFEIRDIGLEKQLNDSAKQIILYGQKLSGDFSKYKYTYITAVQVDNPILALKYFRKE